MSKDIIPLGPWGNQHSRNWSFQFSKGQVLKELRIRHGFVVDGITFVIVDKHSHHITSKETIGGDGGNCDKVELKTACGEHITHISGTSANYAYCNDKRCITSITIHTNLNKHGYGPYGLGRKEGQYGATNISAFSTPALFTDAIVGFHGGANQYLEAIGIFINPVAVKLGPWGNPQSQNWSFRFDKQILKGIKIRHGFVVDAIAFKVANQNSVTWSKNFGGEGGGVDEIQLDTCPKEFVTQISGTVANYSYCNDVRCITSIRIHTNQNAKGYGPYGLGRKEGEYGAKNVSSFSSPLIPENAIVGFHGGAHQYLESIGIFVAPVAPCV